MFLESKTDSENLLALQGFEEWINEKGFTRVYCYWSIHEDKITHGTEGILIFSKITCKVSYGMQDEEFDKQARVAVIEIPSALIVISYNPQGGFSEKSLGFRDRWEARFLQFLHTLYRKASKGII